MLNKCVCAAGGLSCIDGARGHRDGLARKDAAASFGLPLRGKGRRHHPGKYCDHPQFVIQCKNLHFFLGCQMFRAAVFVSHAWAVHSLKALSTLI